MRTIHACALINVHECPSYNKNEHFGVQILYSDKEKKGTSMFLKVKKEMVKHLTQRPIRAVKNTNIMLH